jgi:predicted O-methyltransferase YrrM
MKAGLYIRYGRIRYRKGHGVHSPFVFSLITKVIGEKCPYYCFYDIELLRKQLLHKEETAALVKREAIRPEQGALLFRLANYFKPKNILQIGPAMGLSTIYLTSYTSGLKCISLEPSAEYTAVSQWVYEKRKNIFIDVRTGEYKQILPGAWKDMELPDFVFFNVRNEQNRDTWMFHECIKHVHNDTVFIIGNIRTNRYMRNVWKEICRHQETTVTIDLFSIGIAFFNKKLHKRNYNAYF